MTTDRTTTLRYDDDYDPAAAALDRRVSRDGWPEGEREKALADALNNEWTEGLSVGQWVDRAARRLGA